MIITTFQTLSVCRLVNRQFLGVQFGLRSSFSWLARLDDIGVSQPGLLGCRTMSMKYFYEINSVLYLWVLVTVVRFPDIGPAFLPSDKLVVNFYEAFYA